VRLRDALPADLPTVRRLFQAYSDEFECGVCFGDLQTELDSLPGDYGPPGGRLHVVEWDGVIVGMSAIRKLALFTDACELKRVYLKPEVRGRGWGKQLSLETLQIAARDGYSWVYLDTSQEMTTAISIYEQLGFERISAYSHPQLDTLVYMRRPITDLL
jgi:ribosomal protein S18 acetylase RimI-like enzyme